MGRPLHSSCTYVVEGREVPGFWWSLTVFDSDGRLIPNVLERSAFTSDTMAINPDGTFAVTLSRDTMPGNWLPVGGAGNLALVFTAIMILIVICGSLWIMFHLHGNMMPMAPPPVEGGV